MRGSGLFWSRFREGDHDDAKSHVVFVDFRPGPFPFCFPIIDDNELVCAVPRALGLSITAALRERASAALTART